MAAVLAGGFYANEFGKRLFLWAVAGSFMLHLAMLFIIALRQDAYPARANPPPLTARLAAPRPPAPTPAIEPQVQRAIAPRPAPVAKPLPQPLPAQPARIPGVESARQVAEPEFVGPAAPAVVSAAPAAPIAKAEAPSATQLSTAASGPDPGTVARYRLELMDLARRDKKYPRIAQDNGWQGRVELRILFAEDGAISALEVKKGAGRAVLDEQAQAMIRAATSKATIPPALRGKAFVLEIPVDFFLKDEVR